MVVRLVTIIRSRNARVKQYLLPVECTNIASKSRRTMDISLARTFLEIAGTHSFRRAAEPPSPSRGLTT